MLIRTLRPLERAGRPCRAFACLDLPQAEAEALIEDGAAEPWQPTATDAPAPAAPAPAPDAPRPTRPE